MQQLIFCFEATAFWTWGWFIWAEDVPSQPQCHWGAGVPSACKVFPHWNMGTSRVLAARFQISDYRWWKQGWETEKQLSHMEPPLFLYPPIPSTLQAHEESSPSHPTGNSQPLSPLMLTQQNWEPLGHKKKSIPQLADESSSASSLYPQNPLLELELLSVLPVFSLKTLNYLRIKKAKSQRHLLLPYFPCSGCCLNLLYLEKRFNCNPANIFGEHSKAWSRTTVVTPKHAEGGGTVWLSAVFWGFFLPYSLQQQWRIQKGKSRVVGAC